jgi:hypothetical protein
MKALDSICTFCGGCWRLRALVMVRLKGHWTFASIFQLDETEGGHRLHEALESQLPNRLGHSEVLHGGIDRLTDQNLAAPSLPAEPRRKIGHGANGRVVEASFKADPSQGGLAVGNAYPKI